jgi:uncharacterized membrane protein YjgN (DUF898 family)
MAWNAAHSPKGQAEGAAGADARALPFSQATRLRDFAPMALRNGLFGLITLTLYRFWGRSDMRRRLWGGTAVLGDPVEYNGRGSELLRGALLAIPVLFVPFVFVFYIAPLVLDAGTSSLLWLLFYPVMLPIVGAGLFLMRRYQLSRTRWRGIRMGLGGSAVHYGLASFGWTILEVITFGWFHPAARMRRARMLWRAAYLGDTQFQFETPRSGLAHGLYGHFAVGWFGTIFHVMLLAPIIMYFVNGLLGIAPQADPQAPPTLAELMSSILFLIVIMIGLYFFWSPFNAAAMNRTAALISIGGARFNARVSPGEFAWAHTNGLIVTILSLTLLRPLSAMWQLQCLFKRLSVVGEPNVAEIRQRASDIDSGEGVADTFNLDFGAGVL